MEVKQIHGRAGITSSVFSVIVVITLFAVVVIAAPDETPPLPAEIPEKHDVGPIDVSDPLAIRGVAALARWDLAAADEAARQLDAEGRGESLDALVFKSRLAFFHGDYALCIKILDDLGSKTEIQDYKNITERVRKLADIMSAAKSFESDHFIVRVVPGRDEILVSDTLDTLDKAYEVLTKDLEIKPTSKVVVEIFPSFEAFELATGLSEKAVETSGTVAVCKFSRLMLTTPRVMVRGYPWRDTASHEFVHYLIFLRSGYNCPIWLHEGIAKYEENRWRMAEGGWMSPVSQSLLATALKDDNLITFEEMSPSFAMLPSPRAGQLAFAEVTMCVKYLVHRGGFKLVLRLLDRLQKDNDWQKAIKKELGESYKTFLAKWEKFMRKSKLVELEGINLVGVKIRKHEKDEEDEDETAAREEAGPARKYARLGDLLRAQGRMKAATIEYKKALKDAPNSIYLLNKAAGVLMKLAEFDLALPLLEKAERLHPESYPATFKRLGTIYFAKKKREKSREYFERSANINPFDPEVHSQLAKVYSELGLKNLEKETKNKLTILAGPYSGPR